MKVVSVQHLTLTMVGSLLETASIPIPVSDLSRTVVVGTWEISDLAIQISAAPLQCVLDLVDDSTVRIQRNDNTGTITASVSIIEFASDVTVQKGSYSMLAADLISNETISTIDQATTWVYNTYRMDETDIDFGDSDPNTRLIAANFTSTTNLRLTRDAAFGAVNGEWFTVSSSDSDVSALTSVRDNASSTQTYALGRTVVPTNTFLISSARSNNTQYNGEANNQVRLSSTSEMTIQSHYAGGHTGGERDIIESFIVESTELVTQTFDISNSLSLSGTQTIAAIDQTRSIIIPTTSQGIVRSSEFSDGTLDGRYLRLKFLSDTEVEWTRGDIATSTVMTFQVIELPISSVVSVNPSKLSHDHSLDPVNVTQKHVVQIASMTQGQSQDLVSVTQNHYVIPVDSMTHEHSFDSVNVSQDYQVVVLSMSHGHNLDNVIVIEGGELPYAPLFFDGDKKVIYEVPVNSSFTVDLNGYRIYVPDDIPGATLEKVITTYDLWSRWVDFHNANKWANLAFDISGGAYRYTDELSNDVYALIDIRLLNDWILVPSDYLHNWLIIGNLYPNTSTGFDFDCSRLTAAGVSPRIQFADRGERSVIQGGGTFTTDDRALLVSAEKHSKYNGKVYFDPVLLAGGDGTIKNPFGAQNDAIDFAEAENISEIGVFNDFDFTRQAKNFIFSGVGSKFPTIGFNGQEVNGSKFKEVGLEGVPIGSIIAEHCNLLPNLSMNGRYFNCGLAGALRGVDGATIIIKDPTSVLAGAGQRPSFDMLATGTCKVVMNGLAGGMTFYNCNQATDALTVGMLPASITFADSCTDGDVVTRGVGKVVDNSVGLTITKEHINIPEIVVAVWTAAISTYTNITTIGGWITKKLTTLKTLKQAQ